MSEPGDRTSPHEIVIIKRRSGGHDEGHHGGAWKIAFADFMTALMCFFLVMWLINASDKKTITQIATYFNPLRLNDKVVTEKGLEDADVSLTARNSNKQKSKAHPSQDEKQKQTSKPEKSVDKKLDVANPPHAKAAIEAERVLAAEMDFLRDPYRVIEHILSSETPASRQGHLSGSPASGMPRDLLDPRVGSAPAAAAKTSPGIEATGIAERTNAKPSTLRGESGRGDLTADGLRTEISKSIAGLGTGLQLNVEVVDASDEVLVSIADGTDDAMFSIGSSQPTPLLVRVMEGIGKALAAKGGSIVVRGHTDARPYTAAGFDNWRLSTARAHTAYHMLARAGLPVERIRRIEGHSDRMLRVPSDPYLAVNRRIEILVAKATQ